ncbi:MAG: DEAD/DEAH box helicase [Thermoleophilaceae bacterium]|nr:DEAD/DEAH box helicase [Thermoleophilaceae bacterium]
MLARVDAAIRIDRADLPDKLLERLRRALSFPNPAYLDRLRLGLHPGGEPETLCFLREAKDEIRLPRGAIHELRRLAARDGVEVRCEDRRTLPLARLPGLPAVELRDYQERAVDALERVTQGTVVIPCGGGKTRVGVGAIERLRTPVLILVHTLDLAEQWRGELRSLLGIEPGVVGGGEDRPDGVSIAVIQTLARWSTDRLDAFLDGFGLLILDEAHHVAAATFHSIVGRCPARYRLGLTATPEREDGLTPLLELFLGRPLVVVSHEELVSAGVLALPEIRTVETGFTFPYLGVDDYAPMMAALVADEERNDLITRSVVEAARNSHTCLVLSGRVAHCRAIVRRTRAAGVEAAELTGRVTKERRAELLDRARRGDLPVLVATSLADEGLDLPRLSRVLLAYPSRARGRTVQRLGRLMRPHAGKGRPVLIDFVDRKVPILRRQHLDRRRLYAEVLGVPASQLGRRGRVSSACEVKR